MITYVKKFEQYAQILYLRHNYCTCYADKTRTEHDLIQDPPIYI